jgi:transcriptional regulator with XRE-family HTH domain
MASEAHPRHPQPFGRRISERRVAAGLTQQQLSERVAMSRAALSHLEVGITVASERTVCLLAGVLDLEPHDLVAGTDDPIAKARQPRSRIGTAG